MKVKKAITVSFLLLSMMALAVPVVFAPSPIVQQVTGGGWILMQATCQGTEISKKTFGFNAMELEDGTLKGNVEYVEHGPFGNHKKGYPHVHGYEITALTIVGADAWIEGICRLNGEGNTPFIFHVYVKDVNEPGKHDVFQITIYYSDMTFLYWAGAELGFDGEAGGGGNIQIHVPALP